MSKQEKATGLLFLFTIVALSGILIVSFWFQEPPISSGIVVEKHHIPEKRWLEIRPVPDGFGGLTGFPVIHSSPEKWTITIQKTVEVNGKKKIKTRDIEVSKDFYGKIAIGDVHNAAPKNRPE